VTDTIWGEVLSLFLYTEAAERLFNKYDYIKDFTFLYSKVTGLEFFINCWEWLNYFMPLVSDEVLGCDLQY